MAAEAEDDEGVVFDLTPEEDSNISEKTRNHITTNSTDVTVLIYQTGYNSPMIVHYLVNFSLKEDRYDKKVLGSIGKRESEDNIVWITLQARQFKWKKVTI